MKLTLEQWNERRWGAPGGLLPVGTPVRLTDDPALLLAVSMVTEDFLGAEGIIAAHNAAYPSEPRAYRCYINKFSSSSTFWLDDHQWLIHARSIVWAEVEFECPPGCEEYL